MPEPMGPRDPRSLVSYVDVDAPKVATAVVMYVACRGRCRLNEALWNSQAKLRSTLYVCGDGSHTFFAIPRSAGEHGFRKYEADAQQHFFRDEVSVATRKSLRCAVRSSGVRVGARESTRADTGLMRVLHPIMCRNPHNRFASHCHAPCRKQHRTWTTAMRSLPSLERRGRPCSQSPTSYGSDVCVYLHMIWPASRVRLCCSKSSRGRQ